MYYQIIKAENEYIGIVWQFVHDKPLLENVFLPCGHRQSLAKINKEYPGENITERKIPGSIAGQIAKFYAGEKIDFDLSCLNMARLTKFSARVLKKAGKIPRGKVFTYSELACKTGSPKAARAVGTALARNPFPLVIPCHRVVRSDGSLGGFGGGLRMKKELLSREGVQADTKGRVSLK